MDDYSRERSPAAMLLRWMLIIVVLLLTLIVLVTVISAAGIYIYAQNSKDPERFINVLGPFLMQFNNLFENFFTTIFPQIWEFVSPLAQVAILLFVLEWFFRRMGLSFGVSAHPSIVVPFLFVGGISVLSLLSVVNRPLLDRVWDSLDQVVVMLIILGAIGYLLNRIGLGAEVLRRIGDLNVQAIIAVVIVGALAVLSLVNVEGANVVKDIALVVVGFYFGSRRTGLDENATRSRGEPVE